MVCWARITDLYMHNFLLTINAIRITLLKELLIKNVIVIFFDDIIKYDKLFYLYVL